MWRARDEVGTEAALRMWRGGHVTIVERLPGLKRDEQRECVAAPDGAPATFAGVGEVWFDDMTAAADALATDEWQAVLAYARRFMDFDSISAVRVHEET